MLNKTKLQHIMFKSHIDSIDSMDLPKLFGENISRERAVKGLTQDDMAYMLGISKSTYVRTELAENSTISTVTALKIANILQKPLMSLFGIEHDLVDGYARYMKCSNRTKRLVSALMEADVREQEKLSEFDENDIITVMQYPEQISDGIFAGSFISRIENISEYKNAFWYDHADVLLEVNSDYYHPLYHIGDRLVIQNRVPKNGEVGVFVKNSRFYLRRSVESPGYTILEHVTAPIYGDPLPLTINRKKREEMAEYTGLGVVIAVI